MIARLLLFGLATAGAGTVSIGMNVIAIRTLFVVRHDNELRMIKLIKLDHH